MASLFFLEIPGRDGSSCPSTMRGVGGACSTRDSGFRVIVRALTAETVCASSEDPR